MSKRNATLSQPPPRPLIKQHSWSPDADREEAWLRKKGKRPSGRLGRSKSVTDEDLEELKGCIELGFGFEPDSPELDPRLSETLPALGLYCAVNKQYRSGLSRTSSLSSVVSEGEVSNSSTTIVDQGDDPETMKLRLKQWAQVVACSVRQFSGEPNLMLNNNNNNNDD
ncbi:unnamed protein product [Eruca vesicaria subsp. sativa]|uniref:Membrane insertase, (DUF1685) n=1 Tax=Eruca vesicaria subsp. sativa TaxID=29727 RepID=A0ABC8JKA8_ERUVS|nr:unnamed protein product [Eruca vesicaria subsp. sativa]